MSRKIKLITISIGTVFKKYFTYIQAEIVFYGLVRNIQNLLVYVNIDFDATNRASASLSTGDGEDLELK